MTKYIITTLFVLTLSAGANAEALSFAPNYWQYCPSITVDLMLGMVDSWTGSQVSQLQMFLAQDRSIYPLGMVTGYFGYNTKSAVQNFQSRYGIANARSAGYGVVGPQTRNLIRSLCSGGGTYPPQPEYCTLEYQPVCGQKMTCPSCTNTYGGVPCVGCYLMQKTYSNTCLLNKDGATLLHYGACSGTGGTTNRPPTVSSFSGPTTLNTNQLGTWYIRANDPENGQLTYDVDWGDRLYYAYDTASAQRSSFTQSTTFQHSYTRAGTYTVTITVRDNAGNTVLSSTTVRVDDTYYYQYQQPYYWDYNNYYDNYYYDWNWQNPYGGSNWNNWQWQY